MKYKFLFLAVFVSVLMLSMVSAFWPFTGKAVAIDGTIIDDGDFPNCKDSDRGVNSSVLGVVNVPKRLISLAKNYTDTCVGNKLKEYYCENNRVKRVMISCEGACQNGRCVTLEENCTPTERGVINQNRVTFRNTCQGNVSIVYSCNGTSVINITTVCPGRCSNGECIRACIDETDVANNKDVLGIVRLSDGTNISDVCLGNRGVKQYACQNNLLVPLSSEMCGENRECVSGVCIDKIAGTITIAQLNEKIAMLNASIIALEGRIDALENPGSA